MKISTVLQWTLFLFLTLSLNGCGDDTPTASENTPRNTSGDTADFVFVAAVPPNTLDPQKISWNHDIRTAGCLFEPLLRYKLPQMTLEPAAAESWTVSEDQLTYTFQIRSEARWSNGDPLTAQDFITAWQRAMLPDFVADYVQLMFCIRGAEDFFNWRNEQLANFKPSDSAADAWREAQVQFKKMVGLRAPSAHTLVVELARPTPYFLELCAFATFMPNHTPSLKKHISFDTTSGLLKLPASYWTDPSMLVTNGPYALKRYRFKRDLLMEQNPHWWNKASMGNRSILQKIIEMPQTALLTYQNKEADWLPDIPSSLSLAADLVASGRSDVHTAPWAGTYFYTFNCKPRLADGSVNPMADPRVRRALSMGIDRKTLVQKITRMNQPQAKSFIPPNMIPGYESPKDAGVSFDPIAAKKLLAEAGYTDPTKLKGLSILFNTGGGHEPTAQTIKAMWKKHLGVSVYLQSMEVHAFRQQLKQQNYTIARASWIGDYRDPSTFLDKYHSNNGNNDSRWVNPSYDRLLAKAQQQTNPALRMKTLAEAEALLLQEQPIAPIYHYLTLHIFDANRVTGLHPNAWNFRRLEQVQVK